MKNPDAMRARVARIIEDRLEVVVSQAMALFRYVGAHVPDADERARLGEEGVLLLAAAVRDGGFDPRHDRLAGLRRLAQDQGIGVQQLFGLVYLLERGALDELAEALRAESVPWTTVAQIVRGATFDLLGAFAEHLVHEHAGLRPRDRLTTLYARPVIEPVLEKEVHRAERFGHGLTVIVFDVDRLAEINAAHGYGFGDRVLERIGIVVRNYFREHDWVGRWAEDTFVVLLPETGPDHGVQLAERVRLMIEERLRLCDYRTDERVSVTVSMGVVVAAAVDDGLTAERLLHEAELAMQRAKQAGRNRLETVAVGPVAPAR